MRTLLIIVALSSVGCANVDTTPAYPPSPPQPAMTRPSEPRAILPQWREYVMDHYRQEVLDRIKSPSTAHFLGVPGMLASYNPNTDVTIIFVIGQLDAGNSFGGIVRCEYIIGWDSPGDREVFQPIRPPLVTITERQ